MAPSITNYVEIQNDEIEVLRSIYMDDFAEETPKTGAWNKTLDRRFSIGLKSFFGDEEKVAITLRVSFPPTYPKTYPSLQLSFDEDVRINTRKQALAVINNVPKKLELGTEMIYEIATLLQEQLDNAAKVSSESVPTLDEERATREAALLKAQEEEERRQIEARKAKEADGSEEEQRLLKELLEQEKARSAQRKSAKISTVIGQDDLQQNRSGVIRFDRPSVVKDRSGRSLEIRSVSDQTFFRKGPVAAIFTVQNWPRDLDSRRAEGERSGDMQFFALKECFVPSSGPDDNVRKAIQKLEADLDHHTFSQFAHQNVIKPINYLILRSDSPDGSTSRSGWTVSVLTEWVSKGSLLDLLEMVGQISDTQKIRGWGLQILEGLHYYHRQGSAHASLHLQNVLLELGEARNVMVRLSDGVYAHALRILKGASADILPVSWRAPENTSSSGGPSAATDIWDFGICLLQMGFGTEIVHDYRSPAAVLDDLNLSNSFRALLRRIFTVNLKKRPSAWDVLHFEFFRNDDALLEYQYQKIGLGRRSVTEMTPILARHPRRESIAGPASSRYAKEFVEEGKLGRGGFGEVFRARNRTDGQLYAIKKIKARSKSALDPVLSEASVLSRLNHPNVVRYFASWIDDAITFENDTETQASTDGLLSSTDQFGREPILPPSSRGLDFISSNNSHILFGGDIDDNVVFGDEDASKGLRKESTTDGDEYQETDEDTDDSAVADSNLPKSTNTMNNRDDSLSGNVQSRWKRKSDGWNRSEQEPWAVLHIQMEYCRPETLRNLINTGIQSNSSEGFRLLRQIVQGLAHIHAAAIVHRDLKPENIFIDANGDVRIGDFGLARPGDYKMVDHGGTTKGEVLGSFTKDIGTASYVAPEVLSAGGGKYNEKADMYSLGVVFLEMNVVFATGMERAEGLIDLQRAEPRLPKLLECPERAVQGAIIRSLTNRQPSLRPTSLELLSSGQIPAQDEDETLRMARRLVADPKSNLRYELLDSLFSIQPPPDQVYDSGPGQGPSQKHKLLEHVLAMSRRLPDDLELQTIVKDQLTMIFSRHGAVERTDSPVLFPYHPCYPSSEVLRFLSPSGNVLQLPYDLVLPNAMLLARATHVGRKRTFVFENVYRADTTMDQPRIFGEANFDVVSAGGSEDLLLHEAETIKCLDEVLDAFPNLASAQLCYHINHSHLLNFILNFCEIIQEKWSDVKEIISKLNTGDWTWTKVRHELRAPPTSIPGTCLDELERFDFRDSLEKAIVKLRSILPNKSELDMTFDHLRTVLRYIVGFGVKRMIYLNPLSSYNEKFYSSNMLFQCLFDQKKRSVFAAGGRYDQLIREHQPITSRSNRVHAVGYQLTWTGLTMGMMTYLRTQAKSKSKRKLREIDRYVWMTRRCDVLVDSFDQSLLHSVGIEILSELWACNIRAELAESYHAVSNEYVKNIENRDNHGWVVLIKSEDTFKVKNTSRKEETEIRLTDLATHLRSEIRERDREEGRTTIARMPFQRHISQPEQNAVENTRESDIKVIISQVKSKKVNRKTVMEEARLRAREWRNSSQNYPIIAIEVKDNTFDALEKANMQDSEAWKRLIQDAVPQERQYLALIQSTLENLEDSPAVFIYNFRTKQIMLYHLGSGSGGSV